MEVVGMQPSIERAGSCKAALQKKKKKNPSQKSHLHFQRFPLKASKYEKIWHWVTGKCSILKVQLLLFWNTDRFWVVVEFQMCKEKYQMSKRLCGDEDRVQTRGRRASRGHLNNGKIMSKEKEKTVTPSIRGYDCVEWPRLKLLTSWRRQAQLSPSTWTR